MPVVSQPVPPTTHLPSHDKASFATSIPSEATRPLIPSVKPVNMSPMAASPMVAGPSTAWPSSATQSRFFLVDIDEPAMPTAALGSPPQSFSRCSSEPPSNRDGEYRRQRSSSDSISRTPSIPDSNDSHVDLKSMGAAPVPITSQPSLIGRLASKREAPPSDESAAFMLAWS
ncbi:hypothetical protein A1Q1_02610 [Trichosporon asahii var. asahii CBS 2479]|uniref:Uncharacterized protein n=1 Tax=Trichosporon asahii var. asahii (strain ATCC 90039 / CBS 2479 / JCM 2466 / KCTC 7840 / NBRC 103889/ NCYC 2677 / UAMH 7654) TaxID=1186058 RepID=J6EZM6_TRIAS|nr:hypothetical protein A1Q1_02610 [Trichosporon asahii var. asahii CBS 2479]EJT48327.1 hypothetical protein A1Q1_02610 [Trichosporon asahii var. asahii CBS 2479]